MRQYLASIAIGALLAIPALAEEVEGTVQLVDPASRTIALSDGTVYTAGADVDLTNIPSGASVLLTIDDATHEVTSIEVRT